MERRTTFGLAIKLLLVACLERSHQSSDESRLLNDLFSRPGYNPSARPVANENDTLEISFGAALQQIVKVDELNEAIHLNMWWQIQWLDYNLAWNASDYGNVKSLRVSPNRIWIPDVTLYNRVEFGDTTEQSNVIVSSDGTCFWIPLGVYVSQCSIDIQWFPFDDQTCNLNFESWTYDITKINMTLMRKTLNMNHYKESAQWEIVGTPGHRIEVTYDSGTYTTIIFKIHIRRKAMFFGFNLIMPCILISVLSLTVFGLPPNCGERIGLSVSILVALSVYQVIILDRIPASGDTVPLLGIYFGSVQATGILITAISVFIVNLENRRSPIYTMPNWVRVWICGRLARLMRLPASEKKSWRPQHELNSVDPHMSNHSKSEHMSDIVKIIAKKKEEKENEKLELDQWRFAAYVLDRFCCYLFSMFFVGGTMILLAVPVFRSKDVI